MVLHTTLESADHSSRPLFTTHCNSAQLHCSILSMGTCDCVVDQRTKQQVLSSQKQSELTPGEIHSPLLPTQSVVTHTTIRELPVSHKIQSFLGNKCSQRKGLQCCLGNKRLSTLINNIGSLTFGNNYKINSLKLKAK